MQRPRRVTELPLRSRQVAGGLSHSCTKGSLALGGSSRVRSMSSLPCRNSFIVLGDSTMRSNCALGILNCPNRRLSDRGGKGSICSEMVMLSLNSGCLISTTKWLSLRVWMLSSPNQAQTISKKSRTLTCLIQRSYAPQTPGRVWSETPSPLRPPPNCPHAVASWPVSQGNETA